MTRLLAESPFNNLVNAFINDKIGTDSTSRPNMTIFELLCLYSSSTETFNLASKILKVKPQDISVILGMPLREEVTEVFRTTKVLKKPQLDFCEKYFGEMPPKVTCIKIANALRKAVGEEDEMDAIRLIIMFIAANVLFPSTTGYSIRTQILLYLESMETIHSYNWPVVVHQYIINHINKHPNDPIRASGCLLILPLWFCEHTLCYEREERYKDEIPRIVRWSLLKINEIFDEKLASQTSEQMVKASSSKKIEKRVTIEEPRSSRSKNSMEEQVERRMSSRKKVVQEESSASEKKGKGKRKMPEEKAEVSRKKKTTLIVPEVSFPNEPKNKPDDLASKLSKAYKYSLKNTWTQLKITYSKLSNRQRELLAETPFHELVMAFVQDKIDVDNPCKPNKSIFELLCLYSSSIESFNIGGKILKVQPEDISLILGMPLGGNVIDVFPSSKVLKKPQIDFCQKYFNDVPHVLKLLLH